MAFPFQPVASNPLVNAFKAIAEERIAVKAQIATLQARIDALDKALEAMRPILPVDAQDNEAAEQDEDATLDADGPFAGQRFSEALHNFLIGKSPMTPPEIADAFEQAGWKFRNPQRSNRVNQVGVTLRRFKQRSMAEQNESGKWIAVQGSTDLL